MSAAVAPSWARNEPVTLLGAFVRQVGEKIDDAQEDDEPQHAS